MKRLLSFAICAMFAIGSAQAADKVRVGYINNVQSAVLAHLKSIQKDENLDIELVPFTRYPDVQKALSVNSVDVGVIAPNGLPAAVAQGDRNVIGVLDLVFGGNSFVVRKEVNVQKFHDLKGKRIGLAEGGISWMMFVMLLDKYGMSYNDIQAVNFSGATDMVTALKRGDVDVVDLWEPFVAEIVAAGFGYKTPAVNFRETPLAAMNGLLGASREFARKNDDALVRTLRLVLKGERQLESDRNLWIGIVRGYSKLDDATIKLALGGINYGGPQLSLSKMDRVATFIFKAGIVKQDVTGKLGENVNPRFLARAVGKSEAAVLK
ncbi:MAG: ABC transporter substrate-binding protein [Betaproteobacteria bacterium]|nr:MAG: ABC transporter substrate-binding protein [Betaproteobacteria bacterium]